MYKIILLGPQGSGKGTQGEILAKKLNIPLISAGALLRQEISRGTEIGRKVEELLKQGNLAPDELITDLARQRINEPDAQNGFILDGYPRNRAQLDLLSSFVQPDYVLALKLDDHEAIKRMAGRLLCPQCGSNYHVVYNPPKHEHGGGVWYCDNDEAILIARDDDKPEAVRERLNIYRRETEPLLEFFRQRGILREIDASGTIEQVSDGVMKIFNISSW